MMEEIFNEFQMRQLARFPSFHHSSPLTYYPQRHVVQLYAGISNIQPIPVLQRVLDGIRHLNSQRASPFDLTDNPSILYSRVFTACVTDSCIDSPQGALVMKNIVQLALAEIRKDLAAISRAHPAMENLGSSLRIDELHLHAMCEPFSQLMRLRSEMTTVRNKVQLNHVRSDQTLTGPYSVLDMLVYTQKEMLLISNCIGRDTLLIINYDQWLMLTDTVASRLMTRMTCVLNDYFQMDDLPSWPVIRYLYSWGDQLIYRCGMNAYALLGEFESIVTGIFVTFQDTDRIGLGNDFMAHLRQMAEETRDKFGIPVHHTTSMITFLQQIGPINWLSEIFGIRKHWGNPMVEAGPSGLAVQDRLSDELPISGPHLIDLLASFNRMITLEFIKQHGEWPKCELLIIDAEYPLYTAWLNGVTRIPETSPGHLHTHWALVRFFSNCQLEQFEDQLALLGDKSVSVYREHLDSTFVKALVEPNNWHAGPESRRLILEFLRKDRMSVLDIFKVVMSGATPTSWLANSCSMKGTEMKHKCARIFAVLTFELRQYFAATEELLKTHLFRYNPHQTMTMSELDLLAKLREVTRQMDPEHSSSHLCVMHIIDFSKWNLRMRYNNTCLVFKSIDNFLGTPGLIEQTHILFSNMLNVVQDPFNPPEAGVEFTESATIWRCHNAGWEGQRQKGWTLLTSALLSNLERLTGVHSIICGQGDNQTLLSYFRIPDAYRNPADWILYEPQVVKTILDEFYHKLEEECIHVGLKVKTAESCRSLQYLNYGKRLYFNGVELSMTLKRISKIISEPNGTYPITELLLKTEEGTSFSAGLYSHPSILPYLLSRISLHLNLWESFTNNPLCGTYGSEAVDRFGLPMNDRLLNILMKIPQILGGVPQLSFAAYLFRGHSDPACTDIVMLTLRARSGCLISQRILTAAIRGVWFNSSSDDKTSLIHAPYSFNLAVPQSATVPLRSAILPALALTCRNNDIRGLFSFGLDNYERNLLNQLSSLHPFQPLIANDIFSRSLPGRRQSFISGLSNTTSLGRLIHESIHFPLVMKVRQLEMNQLDYWLSMIRYILSPIEPDPRSFQISHSDLVQQCRDSSWGTPIVGITVPHPLEQFCLIYTETDACVEGCTQLCDEHILMIRHSENLINLPGSEGDKISMIRSRSGAPYLGNQIHEGLTQRYIQCLNPTASWRDSLRLNVVRQWVSEPGSLLDEMIINTIRTRTDASLSTLNLAAGRPSRLSYSHRANLLGTIKSCTVSTTTNMHTRIYLSSNRMGQYSHGEFNYHLSYGSAFLCLQSLICIQAVLNRGVQWSSSQRAIYHGHVRSPEVPIVFDGDLNLTRPLRSNVIRGDIPGILFTSEASLIFALYNETSDGIVWSSFDNAGVSQSRLGYANQLLGDSFAMEIIIREQVTSELLRSYSHRDNPISVGDISLIGIRSLVRSVSVNMTLMAPYSLHSKVLNDPYAFSVCCTQYLETFSASFWSQFAQPLSVNRNLTSIVNLLPHSSNYLLSRTSTGVIKLFKELIVQDMKIIRDGLQAYLTYLQPEFPFGIYAPSAFALRLLWSKAVEIVIMTLSSLGLIEFYQAMAFARDFSHNIHSMPVGNFGHVQACVVSDFDHLLSFNNITHVRGFPSIQFFSLVHPWIDRVRLFRDHVQATPSLDEIPDLFRIPRNGCSVDFIIGPSEIYTDRTNCDCIPHPRSSSLQKECFFMPTGLLSKSHYKFVDIICSHRLSFADIISLGSSTGTDALGVSRFVQCRRIYVNCFFELSRFSPHSAGDYVPPAFLGQPTVSKLVRPSSAAAIENDLLRITAINSILRQTADFQSLGIICDVEMPSSDNLSDYHLLCEHVLMLCTNRVNAALWVIIKIPVRCYHDTLVIAGLIGRVFSSVTVEYSVYSRPQSNVFYFIGKAPHFNSIYSPIHTQQLPISLNNPEDIRRLHLTVSRRQNPGICYISSADRKSRRKLDRLLPLSFPIACSMYVSGLGTCAQSIPSKEQLLQSCGALMESLFDSTMEFIQIANRTYRESTMVRSSILQLDMTPIQATLNNIFLKCNRLELLRMFLRQRVINLDSCDLTCSRWFGRDHFYPFGEMNFKLRVNVTQFYNRHSRYLFEILGTVFGWSYEMASEPSEIILFHSDRDRTRARVTFEPLNSLRISEIPQQPDFSWKWERRAEILFVLNSMRLLEKENYHITVPHHYLIDDLIHSYGLTQITCVPNEAVSETRFDMVWLNSSRSFSSYVDILERNFTMIIDNDRLSEAGSVFTILSLHRIPWLGLVPNKVMILGTLDMHSQTEFAGFPDYEDQLNTYNPVGLRLVGCGCIDCTLEVLLTEQFMISSGRIDQICSYGPAQSVRDRYHK